MTKEKPVNENLRFGPQKKCAPVWHLRPGASFFDFLVRKKYDSLLLSPKHETRKLTKAPIYIIP
ncbi:MAG TPA: hypothetical protein DEB70_11780 [Planctomycetaceae bacterium]|nr:hypothetical protein [Planctomycetaceae bacterium]